MRGDSSGCSRTRPRGSRRSGPWPGPRPCSAPTGCFRDGAQGGRMPRERVAWSRWGEPPSDRERDESAPWPGATPSPSPALVPPSPEPLEVEWDGGMPSRVRLGTRWEPVLTWSGPWRLSRPLVGGRGGRRPLPVGDLGGGIPLRGDRWPEPSWPGCTTEEVLISLSTDLTSRTLRDHGVGELLRGSVGSTDCWWAESRDRTTVRLLQMAAIVEKRRRKSHLADGYRSIVDWTAARADVSHETARSICVGRRLVWRMLPMWPNSWRPVRSASTGRNNWPGLPAEHRSRS